MLNNKILLTTAINYTNGDPHIGHLYEGLIADYYIRLFKFLCVPNQIDKKNYFLTGTDEHGLKIAQKAESLGLEPIELCNQKAELFKELGHTFEINPDHFIRTTSLEHIEMVKKIFTQLYQSGDIYLGSYQGWYSSREEKYLTPKEAQMANYCDSVTGQKLEHINEPSYFFRLSKYQDSIRQYIIEQIGQKDPGDRKNLIDKIDDEGLQDISITRTKFKWGVPVPSDIDPDGHHTIYVWFDALINYLTGLELLVPNPEERKEYKIIHIIGQDILWFHNVIWIGILQALKKPLPSNIIFHRFVLDKNGLKMSKSVGNVIHPLSLVRDGGVPNYLIRGYLLSNAILNNNFKFSIEEMVDYNNGILADQVGNLINRLSSLISKYSNGILVELDYQETTKIYSHELNYNLNFLDKFKKYIFEEENFQKGNREIYSLFRGINYWLTQKEPWTVKEKTEEAYLYRNQIVRLALENFFLDLHFLKIIIPEKTEELVESFPIKLYSSLEDIENKFNNNQWLLPNGLEIKKQPVAFAKK